MYLLVMQGYVFARQSKAYLTFHILHGIRTINPYAIVASLTFSMLLQYFFLSLETDSNKEFENGNVFSIRIFFMCLDRDCFCFA